MSPQQADKKFYQRETQNHEKWKFFVNCSVTGKFQVEKFSGQVPTESFRTQDSVIAMKGGKKHLFDSVMPPRSWEMPVEHELAAILGRCSPKFADHNFDPRGKSS